MVNKLFLKNRKSYRKSQIKMMETVAVLLVFFMLLAVGLIFYASYQNKRAAELKKEKSVLEGVRISQTASFMVELQCSVDNVRTDNCIDVFKLRALKEVLEEYPALLPEYYYEVFKYSSLSVQPVFPADIEVCKPGIGSSASSSTSSSAGSASPDMCSVYDKPLEKSSRLRTHYPFLLYSPISKYEHGLVSDAYYFGVLVVDVYY